MEPIATLLRRRQKPRLHSKEHVLADDLVRLMREPKRFAAYLGIAQRYEESDLRALARRVLEKEDLPALARGKYFFASLAGLRKKPASKKKKKAPVRRRTRIRRTPSVSESGAPQGAGADQV